MEEFVRLVKEANGALKTADHLTYVTYPLVNDVKLLIKIIENLHSAVVLGMYALLYYDRLYKRIGPLAENFDSRYSVFVNKTARRYNINTEVLMLIRELRELVEHHRISPIEFARKDKYLICSSDYRNMKNVTVEKIKKFLSKAKPFILEVNKILDGRKL